MLTLVTAATVEPMEVEEAKSHLRLTIDDDDEYVAGLIRASRQYVELYLRRALITSTWKETFDRFPCVVELSIAKVLSITSIQYVDYAGATQTLSSSNYQSDLLTAPCRIAPAYGYVWPTVRGTMNNVTVNFTAGYGADASYVPECVKQAMKMLIGHWYENREQVNIGNIVTTIPMTIEALLAPERWGGYP